MCLVQGMWVLALGETRRRAHGTSLDVRGLGIVAELLEMASGNEAGVNCHEQVTVR